MKKKLEEIIIPKEDALFWIDNRGRWYHKDGEKFENQKIIDYFHSCIRKDENGYYLTQTFKNKKEKVYFKYEDTALFVFDVKREKDITLVLNTKKRLKLKPKNLFIENEELYAKVGKEKAKFVDKGMNRMSYIMEYDDCFWVRIKNRKYKINEL